MDHVTVTVQIVNGTHRLRGAAGVAERGFLVAPGNARLRQIGNIQKETACIRTPRGVRSSVLKGRRPAFLNDLLGKNRLE